MPELGTLSTEVAGKYTTESNALVLVAKAAPTDKIQVEVGDTKQLDFLPQLKVMRWDNEVNFSVRLVHEELTPTIATDKERIIWTGDKLDCVWYEMPEGYEFEVVLKEQPKSNVLDFTINTKGLDFSFQAPLTLEEVEEGCSRPENVVNSYAVYYKDCPANIVGKKEYKAGKAFHIYRPEAIDVKGEKTWCELSIDEQSGIMSIAVPQKFLDTADYPVIVDPTFGWTGEGGTTLSYNSISLAIAVIVTTRTAVTGDTITSFSAYGAMEAGTPSAFSFAAYDVIAGVPTNRLAAKVDVTVDNATLQWWKTATVSQALTNGTVYCAAISAESGAVGLSLRYDAGSAPGRLTNNATTLTATFTVSGTDSGRHYSVYATYTEGGGTTVVPQLMMMGIGA